MKDKWYQKLSTYLWQLILILLGVFSVIASFSTSNERWFSTFNGVGISLLLSGLLGIFMNAFFYKRDAKLEIYEKWKIVNIYQSRAIANLTIDAYQGKAKKRIDIIAFGLSSWRQAKEQLIDTMLNRGIQIRIITMDPNCSLLNLRDRAEGKAEGATKESILQLRAFFKQTNRRKKVEIKYHQQLPLDFYFRVDDHIFVGPYIYGKESQQMITYEFEKGGEGFEYYSDYFDKLWTGRSIPNLPFVQFEETPRPTQ